MGWTLLHFAAGYGRVALFRPLVDMGADLNANRVNGETPLHAACAGDQKVAALELAGMGADPTINAEVSTVVLPLA